MTIASGDSSAYFTFNVYGDKWQEDDETVKLRLSSSHSRVDVQRSTRDRTYTIRNDDVPRVGFRTGTATRREGNSVDYSVWVYVDVANHSDVSRTGSMTLDIESSGTASNSWWQRDVSDVPSSITIPSTAGSASFRIKVVGDRRNEPNETLILTLDAGDSGASISRSTYTLTIIDND